VQFKLPTKCGKVSVYLRTDVGMCVSPWDIGVSYRYLSAAQEALKMFDIRKPKRQDGKCWGKSVGVYIGWLNLS